MIYAQEILELYPWFSTTVGGRSWSITSAQPHYGYLDTNYGDSTDSHTWDDVALKAGTWSATELCVKAIDSGIVHLANGGASLATMDTYTHPAVYGQKVTATGITLAPGDISVNPSTKNASAIDYYNHLTYLRLVRTGD
mgnify:CR=1 FL=1